MLERSIGGFDPGAVFDERSDPESCGSFSGELSILPATVIASERMDSSPGWRLLESGELVHVDSGLKVTTTIAVPDPPAQMMELTTEVAATQDEEPGYVPASPDAA